MIEHYDRLRLLQQFFAFCHLGTVRIYDHYHRILVSHLNRLGRLKKHLVRIIGVSHEALIQRTQRR